MHLVYMIHSQKISTVDKKSWPVLFYWLSDKVHFQHLAGRFQPLFYRLKKSLVTGKNQFLYANKIAPILYLEQFQMHDVCPRENDIYF